MEQRKKMLKYIGIPIFILISLLLIVVNFSTVDSHYKCSGELSKDGNIQSKTVYMKLTQYAPWVGLQRDSIGHVHLEIPNQIIIFYEKIDKAGNMLHIYRHEDLAGNFSNISKSLMIQADGFGFFEGTCFSVD